MAGEVAFQVPSLGLPDTSGGGEIQASEAVQLFVERATEVLPTFTLSPANAEAVAAICQRLDGIPLAIELAASRVTVLSVDEIRDRLGDRFRLLTGGSRSALPRQQTLQALIDWSWNLLSADDQRLLARLSVFAGGCTLDAAAHVIAAADGEPADALAALDGLSRLVDRSLLAVDHGEPTRYRLLETIRQYARDRLIGLDESEELRAAHFAYFRDMAHAAEVPLVGAEMLPWLGKLDAEIDNIRAALDWAGEADVDGSIGMLVSLMPYWRVRGFGSEAVDRVSKAAEVALELPQPLIGAGRQSSIMRARVVAAAAQANGTWGSGHAAMRYGDEAVRLARALDDPKALMEALTGQVLGAIFSGAGDRVGDIADELTALAISQADTWTLAMTELGRAMAELGAGDVASAQRRMEGATQVATRSGNPFVIGFAALNRGRAAGLLGDTADARRWFGMAAQTYREIGDRRFELAAYSDLAHALRRGGELDEAKELYRSTLIEWQQLGNRGAVANELESFAFIALARDKAVAAVRLLGAAETIRTAAGSAMLAFEDREYQVALAALRSQVDSATFDRVWSDGSSMTTAEAIDLAING